MKPIEEFKTQEELNECLKWWQSKLFLDSWIIKAKICEPCDFSVEGRGGENSMVFENKESAIRILDKKYFPDDAIAIYCAEHVLVHELLHCKYNFLLNKGTFESVYVDVMEHQLLEEMAKTLIMAKYNLDFDYFKSGNEGPNGILLDDSMADWIKSARLEVKSHATTDNPMQLFDENGKLVLDSQMISEAICKAMTCGH